MNIQQIMNNPLLQMMGSTNNPQKLVEQIISQNPKIKSNPLIQNCLNMMSNGNCGNVESIAKNVIRESGCDPDVIMNLVNSIRK